MKLNEQQFNEAIQYLEESQEIPEFKNPEDLYRWMSKNIRYSNGDNYIKTFERVLKTKSGHCHEQTLFEEKFFRKFENIKYEKLLMCGSNGKTTKDSSHSCIIFYRDNKVFWFENSWYGEKGIHEFNSREECLKGIGKAWNRFKDPKSDVIWLLFLPFKKSMKAGISFNKFIELGFSNPIAENAIDLRTGELK